MSVEFPSCYTFLANNATSSSQHSTWCFVNFLLENNRFSHLLQFPVHATAHDVCWISFLSINRFLHTLCSCYSTWCLLNFPLVITRFSHTLHCSFIFMVQPMVFVEISSTCMLCSVNLIIVSPHKGGSENLIWKYENIYCYHHNFSDITAASAAHVKLPGVSRACAVSSP